MSDRLRALVEFAAVNGAELVADRLERIERDLAEHPPEVVPGLASQLRSRVEAAKLAIAEKNGFAAAWLIKQAEQLVGATNAEVAAPLVRAAAGSAGGRVKARPAIRAKQDDKRAERDIELNRLLLEDSQNKAYAKQRSDNAIAKRITPLYKEWADKIGVKPLATDTIRKWLADVN